MYITSTTSNLNVCLYTSLNKHEGSTTKWLTWFSGVWFCGGGSKCSRSRRSYRPCGSCCCCRCPSNNYVIC